MNADTPERTEQDTVHRFSDRVENYMRYRPGYPAAIMERLIEAGGLGAATAAADIGAGTGIFTALLLPVCKTVYAIEPNDAMRDAMNSRLGGNAHFHPIKGTSTATGLEDHSVDCISVAQAFHWFDRANTLPEFQRIAKPDCLLVIVFNERQNNTPFLQAYEEALKTYAGDYDQVTQKNIPIEAYAPFFRAGEMRVDHFANSQVFDLKGLLGRLSSSSYCPNPGAPNHAPLWDAVTRLFEQYNVDGTVELPCPTTVYWGMLA